MPDIIFDTRAVQTALANMTAHMRAECLHAKDIHSKDIHAEPIIIIGIERGGARVADAIQQRLEAAGAQVERGNLDISFYRDDLDTLGANPEVRPSHLPFDISGKHVWLVDDVLYTGRTIRAALGELFDYGRPARISLAVLLDRGGRQLPISADLTGLIHATDADCSVKLLTDGAWLIEQMRVKL